MTPSSFLLSTLAAAAHLAHVAHAQQAFGKDIYWNGPYFFMGCEPDQGAAMKALFKQVGNSLSSNIIPDAELGSLSAYGFKTWFSTNSPTTVSDIYQDIVDAAHESSVNSRSIQKPVFVCVNDDNPALQEASSLCASKAYIAVTGLDTKYVMLCPRFREPNHRDFPGKSDCPKLNVAETAFTDRNSAFPGQLRINYNKQSTIIHELVHKYQPRLDTREVYGINQCIRLSAVDQLNNPNNYAFHSASVVANCAQFPQGQGGLRRSRHRKQIAASDSSDNVTDLAVDDGESSWYNDDAVFGPELTSALANATVILEGIDTSGRESVAAAA